MQILFTVLTFRLSLWIWLKVVGQLISIWAYLIIKEILERVNEI